ncbi:hypothetical protein Rs2_24668 [Raphanus sativus]|nr:hypothetical protein Rs2_24668 [Raphanus sativus]
MGDPLSSTRSPESPFSLPPPSTCGSSDYNHEAAQIPTPRVSATSDSTTHHNALDDDAKATRFATFVKKYISRIMYPHSKYVPSWTTFFAYSCMLSIFVDPLFFFPIEVKLEEKCIKINWPMARPILAIKGVTDILLCVNIFMQYSMAYVNSEYTVDERKKIKRKYYLSLLLVIPFPQIYLTVIVPHMLGASWTKDAQNVFLTIILLQYIPKLYMFLPLIAGQTPKWLIFESAQAKFFINLLTYMLAGHVVGSSWYFFCLQRVHRCLRVACGNGERGCKQLIDCHEKRKKVLDAWKSNVNASVCFQENGFQYGTYGKAVHLTYSSTPWYTRYSYSLFWGFQQISTLAGNQVPSYYFGDIVFTMTIIGVGLLLLALLIGNMQNFLLSLGRRDMEMTLRRRDVEQWMNHRRFPEDIRKRVRDAERLNWKATRGVNEELLFENKPDDLQRDIRRHLFAFLYEVSIFSKMNESILDAIRERLKQRNYPEGSMVLRRGDPVKNMVFIVSGKMMSTGEDGSPTPLVEGDVCGEELLTWCQKRSSINPDETTVRMPSEELYSKRDVCCVKNVEAFSLSVADLEYVVTLSPTLEIPEES